MASAVLGTLGGMTVLAVWADWFRRMQRVQVPRERLPWQITIAIGGVLGLVALAGEPGAIGGTLAGTGVVAAAVFLGLGLQSRQAAVEPNVTVGRPILDFTATDDEGRPFDLAKLQGRPFLLKFFRGHW